MFGDVTSSPASALSSRPRRLTIAEVIPVSAPEVCSCSYCGKTKRVAFHFIGGDGKKAVTCYPCSERGMNWLEQTFPFPGRSH